MPEAKVITCRQCGKKLKIPPEAIGKNVKCSNCAYRMLISPTFFAGLDDGQLKPLAESEPVWQKEIAMTSPLGFDEDEYKAKPDVRTPEMLKHEEDERERVRMIKEKERQRNLDLGVEVEVTPLERKANIVLSIFGVLIVVAVFGIKIYERIQEVMMDYVTQAWILFPIVGIGLVSGAMFYINKFQLKNPNRVRS
jgi:DNA-directed RNA polymerase subunit RPC12/RpoP